jgi:hypothetical protein
MPTLKELQRKLKRAVADEKDAAAAVRAANAAVSAAVAKLPPSYVTTASADAERARTKPLVDRAQKASDRWFAANAELVNARAAVASAGKATLRVVRDSDDLGLDKGTRVTVLRYRGAKMDVRVPSLDMEIQGVPVAHPDLELV